MSELSLKQYAATVCRSGLLSSDEVRQQFDEFQSSDHGEPSDLPDEFAKYLETSGLLTQWQNSKLLRGKSKGLMFGKFCVRRILGVGGMGRVYLAEDRKLQRNVALKVLPKKASLRPTFLERFLQEARALARLNHNNIVRVFDVDEIEETHFIVMEFVRGKDLHKKVDESGPLDAIEAANYTRQVALGLEHAHDAGLIHRDIKPANLLLDDSGTVKISDLGLALLQSDDNQAAITADPTKAIGTADYISPEQAIHSHNLDARTDIYSLGCSMYFLLTGKPPYEGTAAQRLLAHQMQPPTPINVAREIKGLPLIDEGLNAIFKRMTEKKADDRYANAGELAEAIAEYAPEVAGNSGLSGSSIGKNIPSRADSSSDNLDRLQMQRVIEASEAGIPNADLSRLDVAPKDAPKSIPPTRKKSSSKAFIGSIAALLLVILATGAFYLLPDSGSSKNQLVSPSTTSSADQGADQNATGRTAIRSSRASTTMTAGSRLSSTSGTTTSKTTTSGTATSGTTTSGTTSETTERFRIGRGKKFHLPNCRHVEMSSNVFKVSLDEIKHEQLQPCKSCRPTFPN